MLGIIKILAWRPEQNMWLRRGSQSVRRLNDIEIDRISLDEKENVLQLWNNEYPNEIDCVEG